MKSKKIMHAQKHLTAILSETDCKIFLSLTELLTTGSVKVANMTFTLNNDDEGRWKC